MSSRPDAYHRRMGNLSRLRRRLRRHQPWGFTTPRARAALRRHQDAPSFVEGVQAAGFRRATEAEFKRLFGRLAGDGDQQHSRHR